METKANQHTKALRTSGPPPKRHGLSLGARVTPCAAARGGGPQLRPNSCNASTHEEAGGLALNLYCRLFLLLDTNTLCSLRHTYITDDNT
jgi:hypothetical protein